MAISALKTLEVIETMENYIDENRPPEEIRDKVDLSYKIEGQSIILFTIRPRWDDPQTKMESEIAKTTFVKSKNIWKVYWMRASLKWELYSVSPPVKSLKQFLKIVKEDKHGCFWG